MGKTLSQAVKERDAQVALSSGRNGSNGNGNGHGTQSPEDAVVGWLAAGPQKWEALVVRIRDERGFTLTDADQLLDRLVLAGRVVNDEKPLGLETLSLPAPAVQEGPGAAQGATDTPEVPSEAQASAQAPAAAQVEAGTEPGPAAQSAEGFIPRELAAAQEQVLLKLVPGPLTGDQLIERMVPTFGPGGTPDGDRLLVESAIGTLQEQGRVRFALEGADLLELVPAGHNGEGATQQGVTDNPGALSTWVQQMRSRSHKQLLEFCRKELHLKTPAGDLLVKQCLDLGLLEKDAKGKFRAASNPVPRQGAAPPGSADAQDQPTAPAPDDKVPVSEAFAAGEASTSKGEIDPVWESLVWLAGKEDEVAELTTKLGIAKRQFKKEVQDGLKRVKDALAETWGDKIPKLEQDLEETDRLVRNGHAGVLKQARRVVAAFKLQAVKAAAKVPKPPEPERLPAPPLPKDAELFPGTDAPEDTASAKAVHNCEFFYAGGEVCGSPASSQVAGHWYCEDRDHAEDAKRSAEQSATQDRAEASGPEPAAAAPEKKKRGRKKRGA